MRSARVSQGYRTSRRWLCPVFVPECQRRLDTGVLHESHSLHTFSHQPVWCQVRLCFHCQVMSSTRISLAAAGSAVRAREALRGERQAAPGAHVCAELEARAADPRAHLAPPGHQPSHRRNLHLQNTRLQEPTCRRQGAILSVLPSFAPHLKAGRALVQLHSSRLVYLKFNAPLVSHTRFPSLSHVVTCRSCRTWRSRASRSTRVSTATGCARPSSSTGTAPARARTSPFTSRSCPASTTTSSSGPSASPSPSHW